ncbi:MAG TPA: 50S ribosomal protein L29 [Firmicutes bacterium]|jgi:large subunit ribosomal protein L29|nr:50S ribosomal protein L29 [Bacillota bacterium]HAV19997.1 50S ribosomal protein L29 [Bacillota bacterium]
MLKLKEIREMNVTELNQKVYSLKEELFNLRRKQAVGQLEKGATITTIRKDIARIYTVIRERELGIK